MDAGIGVSLSGSSLLLAATYGIAVGVFLLAFTIVVYGQTNEIIIARRLILVTRVAVGAFFMCNAIQLSFDARGSDPIEVPDVRVIRPVLGVVLAFLAFFVSSHQVFRWLVVLTQPLFCIACSFSEARWYTQLECREARTCLQQGGYSTDDVRLQVRVQLATIAASLWVLLGAAYLLMALGACHSRYPVRLFSCTKPLSQVPVGSGTAVKSPAVGPSKAAAGLASSGAGSFRQLPSSAPSSAGKAAGGGVDPSARVATSAAAASRVATSSGMRGSGEAARRREGRAAADAAPSVAYPPTRAVAVPSSGPGSASPNPSRLPLPATAAGAGGPAPSPASRAAGAASPAMASALAARQQALFAAAQAGVLHGGSPAPSPSGLMPRPAGTLANKASSPQPATPMSPQPGLAAHRTRS